MTKTITLAPVKKSVTVQASPARAFEVFTAGMTRWWPATHTILKVAPREQVIEPRVGGRWYAIGIDNSECDTGKVLVWEPPHRLALSWQLNADWQYDPTLETEVELRFISESENVTRVELEHRYLERMGSKGEIARASVDSAGGWSGILELYKVSVDAGKSGA